MGKMWFKDISIFSSGGQQSDTVCAVLAEHFCEIILNLDPWLKRRCCLNILLAQVTILFGGVELFVQFW